MNRTMVITRPPNPAQATARLATMGRVHAAGNAMAEPAFRERTANKSPRPKLGYQEMRQTCGLSAQ